MKSYCEKCFKEVETGADGRCPGCGADLSEERKREQHEADREQAGLGVQLPWKLGIALGALVLLVFAGIAWWRSGDPDRMYPGDKLEESPCGMCTGPERQFEPGSCLGCRGSGKTYTLVYGPNHPGEVEGLVYDAAKREAHVERLKSVESPEGEGRASGLGEEIDPMESEWVQDHLRLSAAGQQGNAAGMQEFMRQQRKRREREAADEARLVAELRNYGIGGAKIVLTRADGHAAEATADEVGRITVLVPPGTYTVKVSHPDYQDYAGEAVEILFQQDYEHVQHGNIA
jgi:hypothetical protein